MNPGMAILTTLGILVFGMIGSSLTSPIFFILIYLGTSIWAGIDACLINLNKYEVDGPTGPVVTFLGCLLLWIVTFPWYLVNKGKLARGAAPLKPEFRRQFVQKASVPAVRPLTGDYLTQLERLGQLKEKGVLSDEEFQAQKLKLLS